jgi:formiminoglutamase
MSGGSSNAAAWFSRLEPAPPVDFPKRPDDPRLGEFIETWQGNIGRLRVGRPVLVGFPQDEGIRRNFGRPGTALAPNEIRAWLARLTPWDGASDTDLSTNPPLDAGNVKISGPLEETQSDLAEVIGGILAVDAIPVVLGGGHETAFGHYLGYVRAGRKVGIINLDAHFDVRPCMGTLGHSGSPFRQAMEQGTHPLPGSHYVCLGAQPQSVSRDHLRYLQERGGRVVWADSLHKSLPQVLSAEIQRLADIGCKVYVTLDADVVHEAEVPAVSAPNPAGLSAASLLGCARLAGQSTHVASFELVEINPLLDRDSQSARWAALAIWQFLVGLANRITTPHRGV